MSKARDADSFGGLNIAEKLAAQKLTARCGLCIVDLRTGDVVHWMRIDGVDEELFDVAVLPGVKSPKMIGFKTDEIRRMISIGTME